MSRRRKKTGDKLATYFNTYHATDLFPRYKDYEHFREYKADSGV